MTTIKLKTQDWVYNSGLVGFINILNHFNRNAVTIKGNTVEFDIKELENFETKYFDYFIFRYETTLNLYKVLNYKDYFDNFLDDITEDNLEDKLTTFNEIVKYIKDKSSSRSYMRVFELENRNEEVTNAIKVIKLVKPNKKDTYSDTLNNIKDTIDNVFKLFDILSEEDIKRLIYIQLIKFNIIRKILSDVSFLNRQFKDNDELEYKKYFIDSAINYLDANKEKYKLGCICCNSKIKNREKPNAFTLTWIKELGVDEGRKSSHFWDFNPVAYTCPICNLMFSCIPLGFNFRDNEGAFFNINNNINTLLSLNKPLFDKYTDNITNSSMKNIILDNYMNEKIYDMQIVTMSYDIKTENIDINFNLFNHNQLRFIGSNSEKLKKLTNKYIRVQKELTINLYDEVYKRISNNQNFYDLIFLLIKLDKNYSDAFTILELNHNFLLEVKMKNLQINKKLHWVAGLEGQKVKEIYENRNAENRLNSDIYRLLFAIRTKDARLFTELMSYLYSYIERDLPDFFINCLDVDNEDNLLILGSAFVMGLKSKPYKPEDKNKGANNTELAENK